MDEGVLDVGIIGKSKFDGGGMDLGTDIVGMGEASTGLEEKRECELVGLELAAEHEGIVKDGFLLGPGAVGIRVGADDGVEEDVVVQMGGGKGGEEEGGSGIDGVEGRGGGGEFGEDERVALVAGLEEEGLGLEEFGERFAASEQG